MWVKTIYIIITFYSNWKMLSIICFWILNNTVAIFKTSEGNFKMFDFIKEIHMAYHNHLEIVCKFLLKI